MTPSRLEAGAARTKIFRLTARARQANPFFRLGLAPTQTRAKGWQPSGHCAHSPRNFRSLIVRVFVATK